MNNIKNIIDQYEHYPSPKWDKKANWNTILQDISTPKKGKKSTFWVIILLSSLIFSTLGFIVGKAYERQNGLFKNEIPSIIQEKILEIDSAKTKDTIEIIKVKTDTIFKIKYLNIKDERQFASIDKIFNTKIESEIHHELKAEEQSMVLEKTMESEFVPNTKDTFPAVSTEFTHQKLRTQKKYSENVFFEDVIVKPKHEFRFINRVPNYNSPSFKYVHGQ